MVGFRLNTPQLGNYAYASSTGLKGEVSTLFITRFLSPFILASLGFLFSRQLHSADTPPSLFSSIQSSPRPRLLPFLPLDFSHNANSPSTLLRSSSSLRFLGSNHVFPDYRPSFLSLTSVHHGNGTLGYTPWPTLHHANHTQTLTNLELFLSKLNTRLQALDLDLDHRVPRFRTLDSLINTSQLPPPTLAVSLPLTRTQTSLHSASHS